MLLDGWKFRCEALEDPRSLWNENVLNYRVSKRPISSLLCNISFIEFFVRGDISNFSFQVLRNIV